jgi:hypothetical protein
MIKQIAFAISSLLLTLPSLAGETLPKDVEKFIAKRENCDHFRGEIPAPGDKPRMKEVNREIRKWCTGTDRSLVQLRKKYLTNAAVMHHLNVFEPDIEANGRQ